MPLNYQSLLSNSDVAGYGAAARASGAQLLKLALLRSIAHTSNPMAALDFQSLVSINEVAGYRAAGAASITQMLELALLGIIAGGTSGGGGSVLNGSGSPVGVIAPTAGLLYINNTDSTLWAVSSGAWVMLV